MKKTTMGGFIMARRYSHIQKYEKEIIERIGKGETLREIGETYGFTYQQMRGFKTRYNEKERKRAAGIAIKKKGRPPKDYQVTEEDKIAELRYIINRKDARIKSLEMENELMRDFLSLTGRK
jgi:hypothetical protein